MPFDAEANLLQYEQLLQWFVEQGVISDDDLAVLVADARRDSWFLANHAQARMVQDALDAAERGERDDEEPEHVFSNLASKMVLWWGRSKAQGPGGPYRVRNVWANAVQRYYNRGRLRAHRSGGLIRLRPMWLYDAVMDSRTSQWCRPRNGTMLPADHPWWLSNYPPLHPL